MQHEEVQQINLRAHSSNLLGVRLGDEGDTVLLKELLQVRKRREGRDLLKGSCGAEVDHAFGNRVGGHYSLGSEVGEHVAEGYETNRAVVDIR